MWLKNHRKFTQNLAEKGIYYTILVLKLIQRGLKNSGFVSFDKKRIISYNTCIVFNKEPKLSNTFIRVKAGAYRNSDVSGMVFELVQQFRTGAKGGYVTVKNNGTFPGMPDELRIKVDGVSAYEFVTEGDTGVAEVKQTARESSETDEQIMSRIRERFEIGRAHV